MGDNKTTKKITRIEGDSTTETVQNQTTFVPTGEAKGKATQLRLFAGLLWLGAIVAQVFAIRFLLKPPVSMPWIIGLIVVDLILVFIGSMLWKKAGRLDPPSEKNKFLFILQSQLGVVAAVVAFLPLIIFILTNKNIDGKQKAILGGIAGLALIIAGIGGADFNPPSVEQYTEQTQQVEALNNGVNKVFWTKSGKSYHLYNECHTINKKATSEIFEGTVAQARELKNITDLCDFCQRKAEKNKQTNLIPQATDSIAAATQEKMDTIK